MGKNVLRGIADAGFTEPRPIQAKTIPQALEGKDVLGLAQTGTGKTAAFALPIIEGFSARSGANPRALILAPTRELAIQIHAEVEQLAKFTKVRSTTVFGGVGAAPQIRALRSRPDIVVACPGRLLDLMQSGNARFDGLEVLVLDEADHMFDMGFLPDIKRILAKLPTRRQTLLFSATMPREIRSLTDRVLHKPHVVELAHAAPIETIEHALYPVEQKRKTALLRHVLGSADFRSAIVFLRTKHRAKRLAQDLDRAGHRAIALQGNMSQGQRQRAMQGFRDGHYDVLVATDIAARGIDVAKVSHVINFDIPNTPDAYTHRIGRTGRAESSGKAYTFVTHEDFPSIKAIERALGMEIPRVKLRDFAGSMPNERVSERRPPSRKGGAPGGRGERGGRGRSSEGSRGGGGGGGRGGQRASTASVRRVERPAAAESSGPGFGAGLDTSGGGRSQGGAPRKSNKGGGGLSKSGRRRKRMRQSGSSGGSGQGAGPRGSGGRNSRRS